MARWSPTRTVQTTVPTLYDALNEVIDRGHQSVQRRRVQEQQDEDRARQMEREDLADALAEAGAYDAGIRRGTAPTEEVPGEQDVFRGEGIGMQRERTEVAPGSIFRGQRPGMAAGTPGTNAELAAGLDEIIGRGRRREPTVLARAGEFVPELGGYAPRNLTDTDLFGDQLPGQPDTPGRRRQQPGTVQLTEDRYLDQRARAAGRQQQDPDAAMDAERRLELARSLSQMGASPEELQLVLTDDQYANDVLERIGGREAQFTEEELLEGGVDPSKIPAAMRDPILARALMNPSAASTRPLSPTEDRNRRTQARDAYISGLIASGVTDRREILERATEAFPETPTTMRDIRAQLDAGADEEYVERRDRIIDLVDPIQYGGGRILDTVVDELAKGTSKAQLEAWLSEAYEGEPNHPEYLNATSYLNAVTAAEGFNLNLGGN